MNGNSRKWDFPNSQVEGLPVGIVGILSHAHMHTNFVGVQPSGNVRLRTARLHILVAVASNGGLKKVLIKMWLPFELKVLSTCNSKTKPTDAPNLKILEVGLFGKVWNISCGPLRVWERSWNCSHYKLMRLGKSFNFSATPLCAPNDAII